MARIAQLPAGDYTLSFKSGDKVHGTTRIPLGDQDKAVVNVNLTGSEPLRTRGEQ